MLVAFSVLLHLHLSGIIIGYTILDQFCLLLPLLIHGGLR